ncbi:MAG: radical SAM family heme chaperone HemW [Bacteroidetes bacterium]|nr:radical SAM family heme chaperone HemW [Bacteroidota bacterium]
MASIYIHIPFCRKKCFYCDFYSKVSEKEKDELIEAFLKEIELQKKYLASDSVNTIYFGGGTPSVLSSSKIGKILDHAFRFFNISENPEITFEANPEDLNLDYLQELRKIGINRLSIGIQSFSNDDLKIMNRRHDARSAIKSVENSQTTGFDNISIDLIYSLPQMNLNKWEKNLQKAFDLNIQHISAYQLTYEKGTVFSNYLRKGIVKELNDKQCFEQFSTLIEKTKQNDFIQYEISNFAKKGYESKHNSNYWLKGKYLGIGPSAHSFNIESRQWNISNTSSYIKSITEGKVPFEIETLDFFTKYNEYLMTNLRTNKGIELSFLQRNFGKKLYHDFFAKAKKFKENKYFVWNKGNCFLTPEGQFVSDYILSELFWTDK